MAEEACEEIARMRRKIQKISKERVLFLDETAVRLSEAPSSTLVARGEKSFVLATDTSSYAKRFDMIACCNGSQVFPPMIFTPIDRSDAGVRGINKKMLIKYIQEILAQQVGALNKYPIYLVMDRASIHSRELVQEFHDMGCEELKEVLLMPTNAAKRMSPLDNALFHDWKEAVRKHGQMTLSNIEQVMADEWNRISGNKIKAHYKHCALTDGQDVYKDCPQPASHAHGN
ncbi:MAG: hypothetical protein U1A28_00420 [Patescibacteria group bacterium]|nr:hypothetical protein [Patescibacteria group bacterium]